jgi:hypothetical protein
MKSKEELISIAKKVYSETGVKITSKRSNELLGVNKKTIVRRFGSWNKFLEIAGIPLNSKPTIGKEERICECGCNEKFVVVHSSKRRFLNVACSNKINKLKHGNYKENAKRICLNCNGINKRTTSPFCSSLCKCFYDGKQITKQFLIRRGGANTYDNIRHRARSIAKQIDGINKCFICGYAVHVEVCHIKDIKDFSNDVSIYEINKLSNLSMLCPNHHYEFDKGIIKKVLNIEEFLNKMLDKEMII